MVMGSCGFRECLGARRAAAWASVSNGGVHIMGEVTLTAHFKVDRPHQGAPLISCHNSRPRSQWHIVDADMEPVPRQVMNRVKRASEAGMQRGSGML